MSYQINNSLSTDDDNDNDEGIDQTLDQDLDESLDIDWHRIEQAEQHEADRLINLLDYIIGRANNMTTQNSRMANIYKAISTILVLVVIIVMGAAGSTNIVDANYVIGIVEIAAAIIAGVLKTFKLEVRADTHKKASIKARRISRNLTTRIGNYKDNNIINEILTVAEDELDELELDVFALSYRRHEQNGGDIQTRTSEMVSSTNLSV